MRSSSCSPTQANSQDITKLIDEAAGGGATVEHQVLSEDAQDLLRMQLKTGGKVAVGVQTDFAGMTLGRYDEVLKRMGPDELLAAQRDLRQRNDSP